MALVVRGHELGLALGLSRERRRCCGISRLAMAVLGQVACSLVQGIYPALYFPSKFIVSAGHCWREEAMGPHTNGTALAASSGDAPSREQEANLANATGYSCSLTLLNLSHGMNLAALLRRDGFQRPRNLRTTHALALLHVL